MSDWTGYNEFHYWKCNFCDEIYYKESQIISHLKNGRCHEKLMSVRRL